MRQTAFTFLCLLLVSQAHAEQLRPESDNYVMPTDVQPVGGGEEAESSNYILDDTIGEGNIGESRTENYALNAGYRQTLESSISMTCDGTVGLGTITRRGDTSVVGCGSAGYCVNRKTTCIVVADSDAGYTMSWLVQTGTGAAGSRTGTGHLNGFTAGNRIRALGTGSTVAQTQPHAFTVVDDARWGGRLSSTSTTPGGAGKTWGPDGVSDTWLRVATGSSVNIASRPTRTSVSGDTQHIGFRVIIDGAATVPTDVYQATVVVTSVLN